MCSHMGIFLPKTVWVANVMDFFLIADCDASAKIVTDSTLCMYMCVSM